ncbi:hypothetical protein PI124_g8163 [Phytophthora idaei]|nr:hypothetical protein PI125_g8236 [Phytophthora idaei]KAG3159668.1 hypothetical protein PI126_g7277 [Phytophthora idaei]KAG3247138.1 hypothetical protein PI124_g8163 [Phytophthora idaei]
MHFSALEEPIPAKMSSFTRSSPMDSSQRICGTPLDSLFAASPMKVSLSATYRKGRDRAAETIRRDELRREAQRSAEKMNKAPSSAGVQSAVLWEQTDRSRKNVPFDSGMLSSRLCRAQWTSEGTLYLQ